MKKLLFIFLGIVVSHCATAQGLTKNGQITTAGATYVSKNGAIGTPTGVNTNGKLVAAVTLHVLGESYQGGIIFYILQSGDPGYDAATQHGFIAAPSDQSTSAFWGCDGTKIGAGAENTALGTGKANTAAIIAGCTTTGIAAQLCTSLNIGGFTDWYLPSEDELTQLYNNQSFVGNLGSNNYLSSTELASAQAYNSQHFCFSYNFPFNSGGFGAKLTAGYVRAIRSF